jgi:hypothetical protein
VNLTQESPKLLEAGKKLDMTYSVKWVATDVSFARRFEVYLDYPFFEHQVILYLRTTSNFLFNMYLSLYYNILIYVRVTHSDSLVLHFQLLYDGYFPNWFGFNDIDADFEK